MALVLLQLAGGDCVDDLEVLEKDDGFQPKILLMDEPLTSLDETLAVELRGAIVRLQEALGFTLVLATHGREEAHAMANRIAAIKNSYRVATEESSHCAASSIRCSTLLLVSPRRHVNNAGRRNGRLCGRSREVRVTSEGTAVKTLEDIGGGRAVAPQAA